MPISQDRRFMYWGTSAEKQEFGIPYPTGGAFEVQRLVDSARNANGTVVATVVGRPNEKQSMEWTVIDTGVWWEMNRWLNDNGMFFWCRYFSYAVGEWRIQRFYVGDISATPFKIHAGTGIPEYIRDAKLNVIDMGAE